MFHHVQNRHSISRSCCCLVAKSCLTLCNSMNWCDHSPRARHPGMRSQVGSITTNKANGGDGIPAELFQIPKDDAVNELYSMSQQIWNTQQWPQDQKRSLFIPISKQGNVKECSNYLTIALISLISLFQQSNVQWVYL